MPEQGKGAGGATYRVQLHGGFGFRDARALAPYLRRLGIGELYVSPPFRAQRGSTHGYDVVDPTRLNPELGGARGFASLLAALRREGLGLLIDTVPNHLAAVPENPWWADVLARGEASRQARVFDIDWNRSDGPGGALSYRRFFDVGHLVGVRVEDAEVFERTHALVLELARRPGVTGLRIDHIDGLWDPPGYLRRLRGRVPRGTRLVVEKILTGPEPLPPAWPVAGTTGYDFLHMVNGLFVDVGGLRSLRATYRRFTGERASLPEVVERTKRKVLRDLFAGEMTMLAEELSELAARDAPSLGLTRGEARRAIEAAIACLPVYRTYTRDGGVRADDRRAIGRALREAGQGRGGLRGLAFLRRVLLLRAPVGRRAAWLRFVMRWQQYTGPATAKGLEDTALYAHTPLLSINEVGADPDASGATGIDAFHKGMRERLARWPETMNATATHDTKRGEDARVRLDVLSELAEEWAEALGRWSRTQRDKKMRVGGRLAPDAQEEVLIYQTLLGAWPLSDDELAAFPERIEGYVTKALREAKRNTSWLAQDAAYEEAAAGFARALVEDEAFVAESAELRERVAFHGAMASLAQTLLKITAPGMPDIYQGTELWDLSLVDPDNRRPVDFALRGRMLGALDREAARDRPGLASRLIENWRDGAIKLYVTAEALRFRREHAGLFASGSYEALRATGAAREHVVAFARRRRGAPARRRLGERALVVAPRLVARWTAPGTPPTGDIWGEAWLRLPRGAPRRWRNVLTGETVEGGARGLALGEVFARLPVALLTPGD